MFRKTDTNSQKNEINCVYIKNRKTIDLLYDYNKVYSVWSDEIKEMHNEAKDNLKYIDIYS